MGQKQRTCPTDRKEKMVVPPILQMRRNTAAAHKSESRQNLQASFEQQQLSSSKDNVTEQIHNINPRHQEESGFSINDGQSGQDADARQDDSLEISEKSNFRLNEKHNLFYPKDDENEDENHESKVDLQVVVDDCQKVVAFELTDR